MAELIMQAQKSLDKDDLKEYERLQRLIREKYLKEGL